MAKITLNIEATFEVDNGDVKALKASTPDNQLATAKMHGAEVTSTVKASYPKKEE